jgi:hypothetical protein
VFSTSHLATSGAIAQVHWDAGAQAGVTKRFVAGGDAGAPSPGFGPSLELQGHVALIPMVRVGAYFGTDLSPAAPEGLRTFWDGGLHLRLTPPLAPYPWRTWFFTGFGYSFADDLGAHLPGGMLEVPVGVGVGRKVSRHALCFVELGARIAFGFYGRMYDRSAVESSGENGESRGSAYVGQDTFALSLSVGLSLEP